MMSFFILQDAKAQEIIRQSTGQGGGSYTINLNGEQQFVQQSIGQASAIGIYANAENELRQGFIQPNSLLSIEVEKEKIDLSVWPNPFRDGLKIEIQNEISGQLEIEIRDLLGRLVYSDMINSTGLNVLELGHLTRGSYMLSISSKALSSNTLQIQKL